MKIQELRGLLKTTDKERLEKAFAESYKKFTKNQKAEVDQIIHDVLETGDLKAVRKKESVNLEELEPQITQFLEYAYAQYYFSPNRVVPKSQRSKWRFMVKNYIKELEKISVENEHYEKSVKLLTELYRLLCEACNYYLFSTDDAFRSVGRAQADLFHCVVKRTFATGYSREKIAGLLLLAVSGGLSRESLYIFQEWELLAELKTSDVKYMAIEEAGKLVKERKEKRKGLKKYDTQRYYLDEEINELCGMILMIAMALAEPESGIKYYFQNCERTNKEITLYCALDIVDWEKNPELWMQVYEYGIGKKIKPRDSLVEKYHELKNGEDSGEREWQAGDRRGNCFSE